MSSAQIDPSTLPPLDKYNLIGTWISTMLYGTNVILFVLCLYVLLQKQSKFPGQFPLLVTSCLLFVLATLHIGASLKQLLECFIDVPKTGIPGAGVTYWLNFSTATEKIKGYAYIFIDTTQDLVLIWRLYVIWGNRWVYAVLPLLVEVAHFVIGLYETVLSTSGSGIQFSSKLSLAAYILVIMVNVGTTAAIAIRLWYMGRVHKNSFVTSWSSVAYPTNRYWAPIFTIVESGAIFTASSIVLLGLFINDGPKLEGATNVGTQLAATTPLLIIVRVGFNMTHSIGIKKRGLGENGRNASPGAAAPIRTLSAFRATQTPTDSSLENGDYAIYEMQNKPDCSLTHSEM